MSITLRTAQIGDLGVIHAIRRDAILEGAPQMSLGDRQRWAESRSPGYFADRVVAGNVVIAAAAGEEIGWGSIAGEWITGLYVRSLFRGRGVGRTIMSRLEAQIAQQGHTRARLESSPNAVGFYSRLGYAIVGLPDSEGAVPMEKQLAVSGPMLRRHGRETRP
jgi:GNAT superfamily N-acetyltransferase